MYQRALQGYEKVLSTDNIINYVPALNTIWNFGSLFEHQADIAKARAMYSKALLGYEQVCGPEHPESQSSRHKLCALDAILLNRALLKVEEPVDDLQGEPLYLKKTPSTSKAYKLLRKRGLSFDREGPVEVNFILVGGIIGHWIN
ncbi:hypothetical protein ACMFMG_011996 [Clarireedia jacksonii]